jgi:hypothetical protein
LTLEEVGAFFGTSRERIRPIERDAPKKLRRRLHARGYDFAALSPIELPGETPLPPVMGDGDAVALRAAVDRHAARRGMVSLQWGDYSSRRKAS